MQGESVVKRKFIDYVNKIISTAFVLIFSCLTMYTIFISYKRDDKKRVFKIKNDIENLFICTKKTPFEMNQTV